MANSAQPSLADPHTDRVMLAMMAAGAILSAGNGVVFALIAEIQKAYGFPTDRLGMISGAFFGASLLGMVALAHLADRGHASTMLLVSLILSATSLWAFALSRELWQFVAARAVGGVAFSVYTASARSIAVRLDPSSSGRNLGRLGAAEIGGFVLGPVVGSALFGLISLKAPFWVLGVAVALVAGMYGATRPRLAPLPSVAALKWWQLSGLDLLRSRRVAAAALLGVALFLPVGIYDSMWSKYLTDLGASATFVGLSLTLYGLPIVLLSARGGQLVDRIGPIRAMMLGMVGIVPITAIYGAFASYWLIAGLAMVEAVFQSVASPAASSAMAQACPPERIAAGQGLSAVLGMAGAGLIGSASPAIYQAVGSFALFGGVAAICAVLCGVALLLHGRGGMSAA